MHADAAERAARRAAAHHRDRILDHGERRDRLPIHRMRHARKWQIIERVHLRPLQRKGRWFNNNTAVPMSLEKRTPVERALLALDDLRDRDEQVLVLLQRLPTRKFEMLAEVD